VSHAWPSRKVSYCEDLAESPSLRQAHGHFYPPSGFPPGLLERSSSASPERPSLDDPGHHHFFAAANTHRGTTRRSTLSFQSRRNRRARRVRSSTASKATASSHILPFLPHSSGVHRHPLPASNGGSGDVFHPSPLDAAIAALVTNIRKHAPFRPTSDASPAAARTESFGTCHRDGRSGGEIARTRRTSLEIRFGIRPLEATAARNAHHSSPSSTYDFSPPPIFAQVGVAKRGSSPSSSGIGIRSSIPTPAKRFPWIAMPSAGRASNVMVGYLNRLENAEF